MFVIIQLSYLMNLINSKAYTSIIIPQSRNVYIINVTCIYGMETYPLYPPQFDPVSVRPALYPRDNTLTAVCCPDSRHVTLKEDSSRWTKLVDERTAANAISG